MIDDQLVDTLVLGVRQIERMALVVRKFDGIVSMKILEGVSNLGYCFS